MPAFAGAETVSATFEYKRLFQSSVNRVDAMDVSRYNIRYFTLLQLYYNL